MDSSYTVVVPEVQILTRLCGTNDSNLRIIEKHLGVPVFTCGNELSLGEADAETTGRFKRIIDRILDEVLAGETPDENAIQSIIMNVSQKRTDGSAAENSRETRQDDSNFEDSLIRIPGGTKSVYPKTANQAHFIRQMRKHDMVFCTGPAGCGKTFLAVAEALRLLQEKGFNRIILTRPVVEAGESLGFLPGDFEQKISPYLRPLFDAISALLPAKVAEKFYAEGVIEIAPLAYMRGRTLDNSILILDEAQNTTKEQMKMFLTRMGTGSKVFITGDITQIDLPRRIKSGLVHALSILDKIEEISICRMTGSDIVRNPLVRQIVQAYDNDQETE
ncbi:MAG: PhoH family protein [Treponemataceae bacterium]|nr:PhoH family protein [Treponemataceae bacterium]